MDLDVPGEILAQLASFLSKKDCNSLMRTSKTAYNKLNQYRHLLPKANVDVIITQKNGNVSFQVTTEHRKSWYVQIAMLQPHQSIADKEEAYVKLLAFYKENAFALTQNYAQLMLRYAEGLSLHLQFLHDNFHVRNVTLEILSDENFEKIRKHMQEYPWNLSHLCIATEAFSDCIFELIRACKSNSLSLLGAAGFNGAPVIRTFCDRDLLSLTAVNFIVTGETDISLAGFFSFLSEWVEEKREVGRVDIAVRWMLSFDEWKAKLVEPDQDLVVVDITKSNDPVFSAKLRRRSDGLVIEFTFFGTLIIMTIL